MRNLAKATNEIGIGIKTSNDTSKKTSNVKEKMTPYKKNKANTVYCEFYYDFGRFSMDLSEKQAKRGQFFSVKTG